MTDLDLMRWKTKHRDGIIHLLDQGFIQDDDMDSQFTIIDHSHCSKEDHVGLSVTIIDLYADDLLHGSSDVAGNQCLVRLVVVEVGPVGN